MSNNSYICDVAQLGEAYITNDDNRIRNMILSEKVACTFYLDENNERYGYYIHLNEPLTKVYGFDVFMVDFVFSKMSLLHGEQQENSLKKLLNELSHFIASHRGYYNFRVPTHFVDLIRAFNEIINNSIFCGGLVTYIYKENKQIDISNIKAKIFVPNDEYILNHKNDLISIAKSAFGKYQGQYHISAVTSDKASNIYTDWIAKSFETNSNKQKLIVAECDSRLAGFWTYEEDNIGQYTGLTGVSSEYRRYGAYNGMIETALNIASSQKKFMTIGTQFDNYVVQRVWGKLGLIPFLSYYNFHVDRR